jgi:hypothetical protein
MMGGDEALFAPALVLLPLIVMQPFDSVAAVAAVTMTTIKQRQRRQRQRQQRRQRRGS